jgi:hypothetical protein
MQIQVKLLLAPIHGTTYTTFISHATQVNWTCNKWKSCQYYFPLLIYIPAVLKAMILTWLTLTLLALDKPLFKRMTECHNSHWHSKLLNVVIWLPYTKSAFQWSVNFITVITFNLSYICCTILKYLTFVKFQGIKSIILRYIIYRLMASIVYFIT